MSETVAEAADAACAPVSSGDCADACDASFDPPVGSSTRTMPSQNAARSKNIMDPALRSPLPRPNCCSPTRPRLAHALEDDVRRAWTILREFAANAVRIFRQFE